VSRSFLELSGGRWKVSRFRELLQGVVKDNRPFKNFEVEQDFPLIGRRTITLNGRALDHHLPGQTPRVLLAIEDITERRHMEERLKQQERLAAIGQMMTGLAHESRNALQRSQAALDLLGIRLKDNAEVCNLLGEVQRAQEHLHKLYEEVRNYAAPLKLVRQAIDLAELIRDAHQQVAGVAADQTVHLRQQPTNLSAKCLVDRIAMTQVFRNILENSVAATPGPVEITVRWAETQLDGQGAVQIALRDNGPGLSAEAREKIFEPFYSTKSQGTGLGMAIAKRVIEAHAGRIAVGPPNPQSGAEIVITLPYDADHLPEEQPEE
jgi:signal transduction histidine kinase